VTLRPGSVHVSPFTPVVVVTGVYRASTTSHNVNGAIVIPPVLCPSVEDLVIVVLTTMVNAFVR
jgi:hypothetical protein